MDDFLRKLCEEAVENNRALPPASSTPMEMIANGGRQERPNVLLGETFENSEAPQGQAQRQERGAEQTWCHGAHVDTEIQIPYPCKCIVEMVAGGKVKHTKILYGTAHAQPTRGSKGACVDMPLAKTDSGDDGRASDPSSESKELRPMRKEGKMAKKLPEGNDSPSNKFTGRSGHRPCDNARGQRPCPPSEEKKDSGDFFTSVLPHHTPTASRRNSCWPFGKR